MSANQPPRSVNFPSLLVSEDDETDGLPPLEAGHETSVHTWINADFVPSWLKPFTLDENTRFTRTPDHLLRPPEEAAPAPSFLIGGTGWHFLEMPPENEEEAAPASSLQADLEALETAFADLRAPAGTGRPQGLGTRRFGARRWRAKRLFRRRARKRRPAMISGRMIRPSMNLRATIGRARAGRRRIGMRRICPKKSLPMRLRPTKIRTR